MFRFLIAVLFAVLYLLLGIPVLAVEWIIGKSNKPLMDKSSLHMVQWALSVINHICGVRLTIIGKERIPENRAVLFVCNHRSYFDIIIGYSLMPYLTGYISKDDLEKVPLLRVWMRRLHCLFLNREDPKKGIQMIKDACQNINNGISMCIFPEGTRNKGEENTLMEFKKGSFKIAERTGCPVVPIAISNTASILSRKKPSQKLPRVTPGHVVFEYGEPIYTDQLDRKEKKELNLICQAQIQGLLDKNKALV